MAVGRSSSGSKKTYCATSLAWPYPEFKYQGLIVLRSRYGTIPLHGLREEDPSGGLSDSSYDRFLHEFENVRVDCAMVTHQLVVTQLSRNPVLLVRDEP